MIAAAVKALDKIKALMGINIAFVKLLPRSRNSTNIIADLDWSIKSLFRNIVITGHECFHMSILQVRVMQTSRVEYWIAADDTATLQRSYLLTTGLSGLTRLLAMFLC
jgi:hypothetical protein